jgi:hypothetical protein
VRRDQTEVGSAERAAARWPFAVEGDVNSPSPSFFIEAAANNAHPPVHLRCSLQALDAHA